MFLIRHFRVREHLLFGLRRLTPVAVSTSNKYCFTKMDNARKHGMFGQNRNEFRLPNNRISSLPSVAGTNLRAHFALLKSYTRKLALYAGCYESL